MFETWFLENENYTQHPLLASMPCLSLAPKTAAPSRFYKTRDKGQLNAHKEEQELEKSLQLSPNNKTKQQRSMNYTYRRSQTKGSHCHKPLVAIVRSQDHKHIFYIC